jgi:3-hydroxyacyl-CoA dehydrogenase
MGMIDVVQLTKRFDDIVAVDQLSLDIGEGRKLAWILAGGDLPHRTTVTEQYLLELEREAFLSLCGEPKTLERIGYTLRTGKTLRN